jgi:hypothetical protein
MAALGKRECDDGTYVDLSAGERDASRRVAASVTFRSALIGIVLTAIVWFL